MRISARGVAIEVEDQGPAAAEPLLLVMGLGMQLSGWPDEFVRLLLARGFRVIRFDNRDAGLSQGFDELGVPNLPYAALRFWLGLRVHSPYRLADMAGDTIGVLDALGIERAHVCGASMGGMIAQHVAAGHPARVKSLTLMMTTSGSRRLPGASLGVQRALLSRPAQAGSAEGRVDAATAHLQRILDIIGSPGYPPDPQWLHARMEEAVRRAWRPAGTARQLLAVVADGDRTPLLRHVTAPTQIIHGEADPLIPVAAAHDLHARIHGSALDVVPGMGHDLPLALLERFADAIEANAKLTPAPASP
jgi:pimeloyl-ACP methyl ester carboxylesterase